MPALGTITALPYVLNLFRRHAFSRIVNSDHQASFILVNQQRHLTVAFALGLGVDRFDGVLDKVADQRHKGVARQEPTHRRD